MNRYSLKTPPAGDPVLWPEFQAWGRDIDPADQSEVEGLISAATLQLEDLTSRVFVEREFEGFWGGFDYSRLTGYRFIELRRSPLISVSEVIVAGEVLVEGTDYHIEERRGFSRVLFESSVDAAGTAGIYLIQATFSAGYQTVPADIVLAIKSTALYWYENRGEISPDAGQKLPPQVLKLMRDKYRIAGVY